MLCVLSHQNARWNRSMKPADWLTSWSWALLEKLPVCFCSRSSQKMCGTWWFITMFTGGHHRSLSYLSKVYFIVIHPYFFSVSSGLILSAFTTYTWHAFYMLSLSHQPGIDRWNYIWWRVHVIKHFIMQFSPDSFPFIPLQSKYSSSVPCSQISQFMFFF
jgi:hypothetical protein